VTTPLAHEPLPGDGLVPYLSILADRLYQRLPEVYRRLDAADSTWTLKRYLGAALDQAGTIDVTVDRVRGNDPIGPDAPQPWGLPADELAVWLEVRRRVVSLLGDPVNAPAAWLPWLAQLVGAHLDPAASEQEERDTIVYATSGYRAGTKEAMADAARSALTGTRYALVLSHKKVVSDIVVDGTPWDITIVTRLSETPDVNAVLGAVLRKGVKPAGAVLWHHAYTASWSAVTAAYPTWGSRAGKTWQTIQESGL
jgi:hypothetical protein